MSESFDAKKPEEPPAGRKADEAGASKPPSDAPTGEKAGASPADKKPGASRAGEKPGAASADTKPAPPVAAKQSDAAAAYKAAVRRSVRLAVAGGVVLVTLAVAALVLPSLMVGPEPSATGDHESRAGSRPAGVHGKPAASQARAAASPRPNAAAQATAAHLPPGRAVLAEDLPAAFKLEGDAALAQMEIVPVEGQDFAHAIRLQTVRRPENSWDLELSAPTVADVRAGDALLADFWLRCVESPTGEAQAVFTFGLSDKPYTKSTVFPVSAGAQWERLSLPFVAATDTPAGKGHIAFHLGFPEQAIEIGPVTLTDYGPGVKVADLPKTALQYRGQEPDAAWRAAANERIEKIRKGDLTVMVTDSAGKAVDGAEVSVKLTRHAFAFGSAVAAAGIMDQSENGDKYRKFIRENFSRVVFENDLKWHNWDNPASRARMYKAYDWLRDSGIEVRGHCLVWPGWKNLPADLKDKAGDKDALAKRISDHVTEEVAAMRGKLVEWDVINEPYNNHDVQDVLGPQCMIEWFKLARAADSGPRLFINDFSILTQGGLDAAHQDHYEKTIKFLLDGGAPLGGIGMQGHFSWKLTPPAKLLDVLDRFGKLGPPIEVTEFDIDITDEQLQADYTRDFLTAMFSHPKVEGVLMWGFWEGRHWRPNGAMLRKDWTVKPNGKVWMNLVHKQWTTNAGGATDEAGQFKVRGFAGRYDITVTSGGKTKTVQAALPTDGATVKVTVE